MSSNFITIKLGAVNKGERITLSAIAACGSTGTITLRDDSKTYATLEKKSISTTPQLLGHVSAVYDGGGGLRLELNITHISYTMTLKPLVNHLTFSDAKGDIKGSSYTIAVEDAADDDYNDYVITVLATKKV
jgi:hypothetical protein